MRLSKKKHYKYKVEVTQKKIWDMEFLRNQYKMMREGIRVEYDRLKEARDATNTYRTLLKFYGEDRAKELMKNAEEAFNARIATEKGEVKERQLNEEEKGLVNALDTDYKNKTEDLEQLERQMEAIDKMVEGAYKPGEKSPLGMDQSINATIENLYTVVDMLKQEIKKL
jgi:hypothetical protein